MPNSEAPIEIPEELKKALADAEAGRRFDLDITMFREILRELDNLQYLVKFYVPVLGISPNAELLRGSGAMSDIEALQNELTAHQNNTRGTIAFLEAKQSQQTQQKLS